MGKGLANALLIASREAFRGAAPVSKVTPLGFLQYLLTNNKPDIISVGKDDGSGYLRDVKLRYRQRGVPGASTTTDDCSIQVRSAYQEYVVPATMFRALGISFEDDQIAKFEQDALAQVGVGNPVMTSVMKDVYEVLIEQANGLLGDIDKDLLALQAANFGKNAVTGSNAARNANFPLNATQNDLASGMTMVQADAMENEVRLLGTTCVGSGLITNYFLQQSAKQAAQNGLDTSKQFLPQFFFDPYALTGWGANQFGLFEKDAVQWVNTCRFRGAKAGEKGKDWFFTMKLPLVDSLLQGSLSAFEFDVQLTYRTCPQEVVVGGAEPILLQRGWNVILMSSYQSVNIPSNSYAAGDRLNGVNGTLRYAAQNV